jgi:hypothetical protein
VAPCHSLGMSPFIVLGVYDRKLAHNRFRTGYELNRILDSVSYLGFGSSRKLDGILVLTHDNKKQNQIPFHVFIFNSNYFHVEIYLCLAE